MQRERWQSIIRNLSMEGSVHIPRITKFVLGFFCNRPIKSDEAVTHGVAIPGLVNRHPRAVHNELQCAILEESAECASPVTSQMISR